MFKLYHSPLACSLAARIALTESGLSHEIKLVRVSAGENRTDEYLAINPSGKVPALVTPEGVLTELVAILIYIADRVPDKRLLPDAGTFDRATAQSRLSYFSTALHDAYRPLVRPKVGCDTEVARQGAFAHLNKILSDVSRMMTGRTFVLNDFSLCDVFLLVLLTWRRAPVLAGQLAEFPELDRFQSGLLERDRYAEIFAEEMAMLFGSGQQ